jgi:exonuclease SbcC
VRPLQIDMVGFGRYGTPTSVDLRDFSCAAIVGRNGSGKTTLLEAISWALWGVSRWRDVDGVITQGADQAEVSVVFDVGGECWRVVRSRKRNKKTRLSLQRLTDGGCEVVADTTMNETQALIDELLGADGEMALATVMVGQGDAARFSAGSSPVERKALLSSLLGIDAYGRWAEEARQAARSAREEAATAAGQLEAARRRRAEHEQVGKDAAELARRAEAAKAEAEEKAKVAAEAVEAIEAARRAADRAEEMEKVAARMRSEAAKRKNEVDVLLARWRGEVEAARQALAKAEAAQGEIDGETEDLDELSVRLREIRTAANHAIATRAAAMKAVEAARRTVERAEREVERAEARLVELGADAEFPRCYTCGQVLTPEAAERVFGAARQERNRAVGAFEIEKAALAEAEAEARVANDKAAAAEARVSEIEAKHRRAASLAAERAGRMERLVAAREAARKAEEALVEAEAAAGRLEVELTEIEAEARRYEIEAEAARRLAKTDAESLAKAERARQAAEEAKRRADELVAEAIRAEMAAKEIAKAKAEEKVALEKRDRATEKQKLFGILAEAFGPDGIPALIFAGVVAELEADAADVLADLSGGRLTLALETRRVAKTRQGAEIDTLDIVISDAHGPRPYESFSGGERLRCDLALRVALARLAARRSGRPPLKFLTVDEGFGALDEEGVEAAIACLGKLVGEFDLVLAVTHSPEVAAAFPVVIEVAADTEPAVSVTRTGTVACSD